jgi:hypothetical protein
VSKKENKYGIFWVGAFASFVLLSLRLMHVISCSITVAVSPLLVAFALHALMLMVIGGIIMWACPDSRKFTDEIVIPWMKAKHRKGRDQ